MRKLKPFLAKASMFIVGRGDTFSIEHRIFNLFCFFVCVTTIFSLSLNIIFGLVESAILTCCITLIQSLTWYLSRVKRKFKLALIITGVELHILLAVNYFINGGISGPTAILFLAVLFLMTSVSSKRGVTFWLIVNCLLFGVLCTVEYYYPESILVTYSQKFYLFEDVFFTYILVVVVIATGILYKRAVYNKQQQRIELKAAALERLDSEKNKLFSIISHDLRAPIGSVKQYITFLKDKDLTESEKQIAEDSLLKSTDEAYQLLDSLLIWTKSQMAGANAVLQKLNVKTALVLTMSQAKSYAEDKQIVLKQNIGNLEILADEQMLQLVIRNLLFNAIKFSHVGGEILFETSLVNETVVFKVQDHGVGISEENQKKVFSLDVKSNVGTLKERGTGLGLLLCKEYTNLQNGNIWFESEVNKGSTFFLALPLFLD